MVSGKRKALINLGDELTGLTGLRGRLCWPTPAIFGRVLNN